MTKRNIPVNVILHTPEKVKEIMNQKEIEEFWIDKMLSRIRECPISNEVKYSYLRNLTDKTSK